MKRREFISLVGVTAAAWPLSARGQKAAIRIGFLASGAAASAGSAAQIDAIRQGYATMALQKHILDDGQILVTHMERFKAA